MVMWDSLQCKVTAAAYHTKNLLFIPEFHESFSFAYNRQGVDVSEFQALW
jgi:hypothetical protein